MNKRPKSEADRGSSLARRRKWAARRLARARAILAAAFVDEADEARDGSAEQRLIDEAVRHCLAAAAGLEQSARDESGAAA